MEQTTRNLADRLRAMGASLVALGPNHKGELKRPDKCGWQKTPRASTAWHGAKAVGIIPCSVGLLVVDVDRDVPAGVRAVERLMGAPLVSYESTPGTGKRHLCYPAPYLDPAANQEGTHGLHAPFLYGEVRYACNQVALMTDRRLSAMLEAAEARVETQHETFDQTLADARKLIDEHPKPKRDEAGSLARGVEGKDYTAMEAGNGYHCAGMYEMVLELSHDAQTVLYELLEAGPGFRHNALVKASFAMGCQLAEYQGRYSDDDYTNLLQWVIGKWNRRPHEVRPREEASAIRSGLSKGYAHVMEKYAQPKAPSPERVEPTGPSAANTDLASRCRTLQPARRLREETTPEYAPDCTPPPPPGEHDLHTERLHAEYVVETVFDGNLAGTSRGASQNAGMVWDVWDETLRVWRPMEDTYLRSVIALSGELYWHRMSTKKGDDGPKVVFTRDKVRGGSYAHEKAVYGRLSRRYNSAVSANEWDTQAEVIGLRGGRVLDTHTGAIRPAEKTDYVRHALNAVPGRAARTELVGLWDQFIHTALPCVEDRQAVLAWFGQCLTGNPVQKALLLVGKGGSGKNTLVEAVLHAFGTYGGTLTEQVLVQGGEVHARQDNLALMAGKRLAFISEVPDGRLDVKSYLQLTGNDIIHGRRIGHGVVSFPRTFGVVVATNELPGGQWRTEAIRRRTLIVRMDEVAKEVVEHLPDLLRECASEVLDTLVEGMKAYRRNPAVLTTQSAKRVEVFDTETSGTDEVDEFVREVSTDDPTAYHLTEDWHKAYMAWAKASGAKPLSKVWLSRRLGRTGMLTKHRTMTDRGFVGRALTPPKASATVSAPVVEDNLEGF